MKPMLLLGAAGAGKKSRPARGLLIHCDLPADALGSGAYSAVVVLNDRSAGAARRLSEAFALRRRHRGVAVGVLTFLDGDGPADGATAGTRPALAIERISALLQQEPQLRMRLDDDAVSFEYQVV